MNIHVHMLLHVCQICGLKDMSIFGLYLKTALQKRFIF